MRHWRAGASPLHSHVRLSARGSRGGGQGKRRAEGSRHTDSLQTSNSPIMLPPSPHLPVVSTGTATVSTGTTGRYLATRRAVDPPRVSTTMREACTWRGKVEALRLGVHLGEGMLGGMEGI